MRARRRARPRRSNRRAIYQPDNLAEMERFLGHPVDDSHCLP